MGNCFGKQSSSADNFQSPGRSLGSASSPPQPAAARVPAPKKPSYTPTPAGGRTVGSSPAAAGDDPKSAAARAAEERAKANQGKGKLGRQLDAQKSQTQYGTLAQASQENRAARDADAVTEARNYN
ncbi:hypothetical protein MBLNU459_g6957t1 [Dothideomycetes sp. NU459]